MKEKKIRDCSAKKRASTAFNHMASVWHFVMPRKRRTGICKQTESFNSPKVTEEWKEVYGLLRSFHYIVF